MAETKEKTTSEKVASYRAPREPGVLSKVWNSSGTTIVNGFDIAETSTKTIANAFRLGNELLLPNIIEAKFDTQVSLQESVMKLMELGVEPQVATEYLKRDIM